MMAQDSGLKTQEAGLRWPAEWEPHAATWLAWPHNQEDWPGRFEPIPWVYASIVGQLLPYERIRILVDERSREQAIGTLRRCGIEVDHDRLALVDRPTDRVWTRDFAPIVVKNDGQRQAIKWQFNAWAKYTNWQNDDAAGTAIAQQLRLNTLKPARRGLRIVLEGGSIDGNGVGTLLTSEECLLSDVQTRNQGLSRADYERIFAEFLGIRKTLWLDRGIVGDDTHGHIDDLARFVDAQTVVAAVEDDPQDPNYEPLQANWRRLQEMTTADGERLRLVKLPMPAPIYFDGQRLPASYANFYIANEIVIVPTFDDVSDRVVLNTLAELFPRRRIIGIHARDLVWGLGTLHCMTMQEPA